MLKINFNTIVPYPQRKQLIKSLRDLGFEFHRLYSGGVYSMIMFRGRLPTGYCDNNIDIWFDNDSVKNEFIKISADYIELYFMCERKQDYENKC